MFNISSQRSAESVVYVVSGKSLEDSNNWTTGPQAALQSYNQVAYLDDLTAARLYDLHQFR